MSAHARAVTQGWTTRRYGAADDELLDLFVPVESLLAPVPLVVYLGGGYWRQSRRELSFLAPGLLRAGCAFAAVDYSRARPVDLMVAAGQVAAAVEWLSDAASHYGFDPARIVLAGSASGAHLAAMVALRLHDNARLSGVVLLSGIFELAPLMGTSLCDLIRIDPSIVASLSPLHLELGRFPAALLCLGETETAAYRRQTAEFARRLSQAGRDCTSLVARGRNHYEVVSDLIDPAAPLNMELRRLLGLTPVVDWPR